MSFNSELKQNVQIKLMCLELDTKALLFIPVTK